MGSLPRQLWHSYQRRTTSSGVAECIVSFSLIADVRKTGRLTPPASPLFCSSRDRLCSHHVSPPNRPGFEPHPPRLQSLNRSASEFLQRRSLETPSSANKGSIQTRESQTLPKEQDLTAAR